MGQLAYRTEAAIADFCLRKVMKVMKEDDPSKKLLKIIDFSEKLSRGSYTGAGFANARKAVSDPNSRWMRWMRRAFDEIDENILHTHFMNIAYRTGIWGIRQKIRLMNEHGCNIPSLILFDPTTACNMHCKGCWAAEYGNRYNLDFETMCSIVEQGRELGTFIFLMTGGEPTVRAKDIIRLAEKYPDCCFHLYTNGTLIDDAMCEEFRRLGNISVAISIEGFESETDSRRGEGSFSKALETMDRMKRHKLLFACSICYTSANYKSVTSDDFLQLLIDHGCRLIWYFHYMPVGAGAVTSLLLNKEQRAEMIERIRFLRSDESEMEIFPADFQNDGQFVGGCIAGGRSYFHINANGDMEPCVFIHYSDSNIHDKTILEALKSPLFMAYHDGQPFNKNHLRPCPMLENPEFLRKIVRETGSKSTDYSCPEDVDTVCARCDAYASQWKDEANEMWQEFGPEHPLGTEEHLKTVAAKQAAMQTEYAEIHRKEA